MEKMYLKLLELLGTIPDIKYIDLDYGQLQEEVPPLAYPAVLIKVSESREDVNEVFQIVSGSMSLTVISKNLGETNAMAPEAVRKNSLAYLALNEKIYEKLQGYHADGFDAWTNLSKKDQLLRKGLKTVVQEWATSWRENKNTTN